MMLCVVWIYCDYGFLDISGSHSVCLQVVIPGVDVNGNSTENSNLTYSNYSYNYMYEPYHMILYSQHQDSR